MARKRRAGLASARRGSHRTGCANDNRFRNLRWLRPMFDLKGKRVFVAGHRGMVGSAIVRRLAGEQCEVLTAGRGELDLIDQATTRYTWNTSAYSRFTLMPWVRATLRMYSGSL